MSDEQILEKFIDLSDSDLDPSEKDSLLRLAKTIQGSFQSQR